MAPFFVCIVLFFGHTGPLDVSRNSFWIVPTTSLDCFYNIADELPAFIPPVWPSTAFGTPKSGLDGFPDSVVGGLVSFPDEFSDILFAWHGFVPDAFARIVS